MSRPLVLIDVDGCLNPYQARACPQGYDEHRLTVDGATYTVYLSPRAGERLSALADRADLVWATTWEHHANTLVGPLVGLPELPVIEFPKSASGLDWKLGAVREYAEGRPLAWIEDELYREARQWADARAEPTLLVVPRPHVGLTTKEFGRVEAFVSRHSDTTP